MENIGNYFTPSRTFLLFWVALISGLIIGSYISWPPSVLIWLTLLWGIVAVSGQEKIIELTALTVFAIGLGILLWQLTSGESWLHLTFIDHTTSYLVTIRDQVTDQIFGALPEPHGSLLVGILFGNRVKLDPDLIKQFQVVGLSHIVAVSGYNLTILSANLRTIFRPTLGRKALWLVLIIMLLFVLITGAPASIVRAAVMASLAIIAELIGRPNKSINALVLAAGIMAIFQPKMVFNIGFQLSLAATYGLLRFSPLLKPALQKLHLPKILTDILSESLAAIIMTAPLIILYFSRLSVISPLSNIIILPLVPLLMGLGLTGAVLIFIWPLVGNFFIQICWPILTLIIWLTNYLSRLHWASVEMNLPVLVIILVMAVIIASVEYLRLLHSRSQSLRTLWLH